MVDSSQMRCRPGVVKSGSKAELCSGEHVYIHVGLFGERQEHLKPGVQQSWAKRLPAALQAGVFLG